jgi:hypothetical protein
MSFEKNQAKEDSKNFVLINQNKEEKDNNINNTEDNLLLKPKAIKQNILNINPISNLENKYQKAPIIYPNPLQAHYINESNDKINYIKNKENEIQKNNINEKGAFSLLLNNNINNNKNNININYIKSDSNNNLQNPRIHCTCKKTKCIKKYCECFSSGNLCYNCKCENCENKPYYIENKNNIKKEEENIELDEDENEEKKLIICTCSKSGCNKNYCECFKAKVKCNNKCRCIKCLNKQDEKKELEVPKIIMRSKSSPINISNNNNVVNNVEYNNTNIADNFTVQRISVIINKVQTLINIEKLDSFDSYKFLNKKRNIS